MAIKDIYKQTITSLANEKAQEVEKIKQKVTQEKIVPHNVEVDKKLSDAIKELTEKHNQSILNLQTAFNDEKQRFIDMANEEKKDFAEATINAECEVVRRQYDEAISYVRNKFQDDEA